MSKRIAKRALLMLLGVLLVGTMLTGCLGKGASENKERRTLRIGVMYGDSVSDHLQTQYTDLYKFRNKHIDIEIIPAVDWSQIRYNDSGTYEEPNPIEEMRKLIEGPNPPDIIISNYDDLPKLIEDNLLQSLEPYMEKNDFDVEDFVPAVINGIKEAGNGTVYALAPTFSSSALIYNKGIFTERGVDFPRDNMTWPEVFELAERVAYGEGNERVYGFAFSRSYWDDLFWSMDTYSAPLQLSILDESGEALLVDSEPWARVWEDLVNLKQKKVLPEPPDYNSDMPYRPGMFEGDPFLSGRLAMGITHYSSLNEIIAANNNAANIDDFTPIEWDVVTIPTHDDAPGRGGQLWMEPLLSISANAQNSEDAWDFIQFINGKEWADLKSRSLNMLVTRKDYIQPQAGLDYNMAAFYSLTPVSSMLFNTSSDIDPNIRQNLWSIYNIGQMKLMEVVNDGKDIRQALAEWATEGQAMIKQIKENPEAPIGMFDHSVEVNEVILD